MNTAQFKQEFLTAYNAISSFGAPGYKDWEISTFLSKAQERIVLKRLNPKGNKYGEGVEQTEKRRVDLSKLITSAILPPSVVQNGVMENGTLFQLPDNFLYTLNERAITGVNDCTRTGQYMIIFDQTSLRTLSPGDTLSYAGNIVATVVSGTNNYVFVTTISGFALAAGQTLVSQTGNNFVVFDAFPAKYVANIKPVTHDEYNVNRHNPHKQPYEQLLWRMDYGAEDQAQPYHEIITDGSTGIRYYLMRYYRRPTPIIVGNIAPRQIDGLSAVTECELHEIIHREIVDEAVMIADANAEARKLQINNLETQKSE